MTKKYQQKPDLIAADMNGETVMLSVSTGKYFGLKGSAQLIWETLAEPVSIEEIVKEIQQKFDVDEHTSQKDCELFLNELIDKDLIKQT